MYAMPSKGDKDSGEQKQNEAPMPVFHDSTEDDAAVRAFKENLRRRREKDTQVPATSSSLSSSASDVPSKRRSEMQEQLEREERRQERMKIKSDPNFAASSRQSALERDVGKRYDPGLTQAGNEY